MFISEHPFLSVWLVLMLGMFMAQAFLLVRGFGIIRALSDLWITIIIATGLGTVAGFLGVIVGSAYYNLRFHSVLWVVQDVDPLAYHVYGQMGFALFFALGSLYAFGAQTYEYLKVGVPIRSEN